MSEQTPEEIRAEYLAKQQEAAEREVEGINKLTIALAELAFASSQSKVLLTLADAQQAIDNNKGFLDLPSPSNAQVVAQVKALTRQINVLIRLGRSELMSGATITKTINT